MKASKLVGYSFVECIIGFTLLGLIAGIIIPVYGDYTKRSRVAEVMKVAHAAKLAVSDYFLDKKAFPDHTAMGGLLHSISSPLVQSIAISHNGVITVASNPMQLGTNLNMVLTPTGTTNGVTWTCRATGDDMRMVPASCR